MCRPSGAFLAAASSSGSDLPFFFHAVEHQVAAVERCFRIRERRKFRAVHHPGEERGFRKLQVRDRFPEIKLRGRGETVVAVSEVHLVGVHGEDLRLGVAALDLQREEHLLHLAAEAAVAAVEEEIAGELHGDGAGARR